MVLALTLRSLTSTLLPQSTIGIPSQTRTRSPGDRQTKQQQAVKALTVPVGNVLVGDARSHIEHDDTTLAVDIVSIPQTTELLLASGIPHVKLDCTQVLRGSARNEHEEGMDRRGFGHTVVKVSGCTSTPSVAIYFFSNSPVRWRLTKVVCKRFVSCRPTGMLCINKLVN